MDASAYYYTMNLLLINAYREASDRMMYIERPLSPIEALTHHNLQSVAMRIMRHQELLTEAQIQTIEEMKYADPENAEPIIEVELPECALDEPDSEDGPTDEYPEGGPFDP
jgi:DNA polymerase/3'-5' exonuclease PolX